MDENCEKAYAMWEEGIEPSFSTGIASGELTCGYGKLDEYGYWEFPLYPAERYRPANLRRNFKQLPNGYTLKPCPFCGHQPREDNLVDSVCPSTRTYTVWEAGCVDNEGGCNAYVLGGTALEAIDNWNNRTNVSDETAALKQELKAWRSRFLRYTYRPQDDIIALKMTFQD